MRTPEEKKAAQAAAHKKWRQSEKGKAYAQANKLKHKLRRCGVNQEPADEQSTKPASS
jgi:hypothetical protein